jgi:hypothetical protein
MHIASMTNTAALNIDQNYFATLGAALEAHIARVHRAGGVFADNAEEMYMFISPISYGQSAYDHRELASLKGRKTTKAAHFAIFRMETGTYELTSYIA